MPTSAFDVYHSVERVAASPRQLEAALLFKSARQMEAVMRTWDAADRPALLRAALEYNTRLWSVFQASMEEPENTLPQLIRLNILRLVRFIDRRTLDLLGAPTPEKLQPLIEINRQIAMGLSTTPADPSAAKPAGEAAA